MTLLTIAGFDPTAGAGITADLKTFAAHNCYGIAAVTALTVQTSEGVLAIHPTPAPVLEAQLEALAGDVTIAAIKIGMLANRDNARVVAEFLGRKQFPHVVLDPIIVSTTGFELLDAKGVEFLKTDLIRHATVITPNVPEAQTLSGIEVKNVDGAKEAARKLFEMGAKAVVIKGGHLEKPVDLVFNGTEFLTFGSDRVRSENTHGTGCTFASAVAAALAEGKQLPDAVVLAKAYVTKAIEKGFGIGKGRGTLNHFFRMQQEPYARVVEYPAFHHSRG
jgi:hydroxymethylpyrimidine kinase/phosphomethylpyrimidine kinase